MREYEEYERGEEIKALGQVAEANLKAILDAHSADNLGQLAKYAYKYTDCGASLGAMNEGGRWIYGDELRAMTDFVCALSISSIVEGVEQCTETHIVDLFDDNFESPQDAVKAYDAALDAVEKEAEEIWKQTHGCPTCAKHFGNVDYDGIQECEGDDGITPIWDECPDCGGHGSVI